MHLVISDISEIDWQKLHSQGFKFVIFDKDNTLTAPYELNIASHLKVQIV